MRCQNSAEPGMGAWPPTTRGSPRCPCGNRAATKRWHRSGEPREQPEQGWGSPEPARRRPPGGPARPRTRRGSGGGSGGCGFGVGIAAGSRVRPPGKGVGSWEGTGGTAGSVDNVFGDVKDDLGSFCAQVMQRLIKKKKKKLRN